MGQLLLSQCKGSSFKPNPAWLRLLTSLSALLWAQLSRESAASIRLNGNLTSGAKNRDRPTCARRRCSRHISALPVPRLAIRRRPFNLLRKAPPATCVAVTDIAGRNLSHRATHNRSILPRWSNSRDGGYGAGNGDRPGSETGPHGGSELSGMSRRLLLTCRSGAPQV
jgi:hypothetical protein